MRKLTRNSLLLLALALAACGDSRLKKLTAGIPRDSVIKVMGGEPERVDAYRVNTQLIEALMYGKKGADSGKTEERKMSPVVVIDGVLTAWGWTRWDSIAGSYQIPLKKK